MRLFAPFILVFVSLFSQALPFDRVPGNTYRWYNAGTYKAPKLTEQTVSVNVGNRYVNEIALGSRGSEVDVRRAEVVFADGEVMQLDNIEGTYYEGRGVRTRLHRRWAYRVQRINLTISSPGLIGSRGQLVVQVGLAR